MAPMIRVIDDQRDCLIRLENLYKNLRKEPILRRVQATIDRYENERALLWALIEKNDQLLMANAPPEDYEKEMENSKKLNTKFIACLDEWRVALGEPETSKAILHLPEPDIPSVKGLIDVDLPPAIKVPETSAGLIPTNPKKLELPPPALHSPVNLSSPVIQPVPTTLPTFQAIPTEQQAPTWNQIIDSEPSEQNGSGDQGITQLLRMLAENQKEVMKLTARNMAPRHLEPPKIDIASFDGNIKHYRLFKDMFIRAVSTCNWSKIDLFMYLQSKLTGDAYSAISSLEITEETYGFAWDILERRFNNKRKLIESTLRPLIDGSLQVIHNDCESGKTFMSTYQALINNLKQYKVTIEEVIMELILPKMNATTRSRFEDHIGRDTEAITPTFNQLDYFLEKEIRIWSNINSTLPVPLAVKPKPKSGRSQLYITTEAPSEVSNNIKCFICQKHHVVVDCDQFLSSNDREKLLRFHRICIFCTKHRYKGRFSPCNSKKNLKCDICQSQHITLMHPLDANDTNGPTPTNVHVTQGQKQKSSTILPTAIVSLLDPEAGEHLVRCLVDLCAERSYISESVVQTLKLKKYRTKVTIAGINGIRGSCNAYVKLVVKLTDNPNQNIEVDALVVPNITGRLPEAPILKDGSITGLKLADHSLHKPSFVGALLGGDIAPKLFMHGVPNKITEDGYLLQPTHLGWLVSGPSSNKNYVSTFVTVNENFEKLSLDKELSERILAFYELPEPDDKPNAVEEYCEKLFKEKHYRMPDGRYVVPIPWKEEAPQLGHSYRKAHKMFISQENRWRKNQEHYNMSNKFMQEYQSMEHMSQITSDVKKDTQDVYYIPYMSILRKDALTTKLRNVFNASMPTSNGISLNDRMHEGPSLQTNIRDILIVARSFKYIYTADISKMFRQILVLPEDRKKLRILWRATKEQPVNEFQLNTVTYGTDSAPYLAIRTLHQAGEDNATPEIAEIIKKAFYMDDLVYGADSTTTATQQIREITAALESAKLPLTKWMSNSDDVMNTIAVNDRITSYTVKDNKDIKLLGVVYNFKEDCFQLHLKKPDTIKFTKRGVSSVSASFYDPLGFVLPFTMVLRMFLQKVWQQKVEWDDTIPEALQQKFTECLSNVEKLNNIKIPRHVACDSSNMVEIIGFSDASGNAQAAVLYSRVATETGYNVTFLIAKGNVTKIKTPAVLESKQCTIPKMELEALLTLCELFKNVKENFKHRNIKFTAYTDSQVVLSWVRNIKSNNGRFVERRVNRIRKIISPEHLHYVKSEENPADPASRGLTADKLSSCSLWFLGPSWLKLKDLPRTPFTTVITTLVNRSESNSEDMFARFSDWQRVLRVVTTCLRWKSRIRGTITADEIVQAKSRVIRYYQVLHLNDAIDCLKKGNLVSKKHWLYRLSPFLDVNGTLRVGGRLGNALEIAESQRHPIVIPKCHGLTLLVDFVHLRNGHAGNSLILRLLIEEYWIPGIKNVVKSRVLKCTTCIRWRSKSIQPLMSQLPEQRVRTSSTFDIVGVDLCGPFNIKASPLRFDRSIKVWVVNFVCFSTKATHLELITSLSSEHFLAAFTRFCSRRGVSSEVWSDNGTNLVGANRMLQETWKKAVKDCETHSAIQEVRWKFIPRHSPTFGGLWEACVKSLKYFTKRMENVKNLTYEEFSTLLCKIEALLNSRPLHANPLNPEDEPALTPFHFLTQRGYKPSSIDGANKTPLTKKWLTIQQVQREFWVRFKSEYLRELQVKSKWLKPQPNLAVNDIVLIKEPSQTPGNWKMGKVKETYPDPQGVVRKVSIITSSKEEKLHAVNQLVPLLKEGIEDQTKLDPDVQVDNDQPKVVPDVPTLRKSPRLAASKFSLVNLCLLTLLVCLPRTSTLRIDELTPGVHLRRIGKAYIKAFDLDFSIKTTVNLTKDVELIRKTAIDFHQECLLLTKTFKRVADQCATLNVNIAKVANHTATEISNSYKSRQKRWISITSKGLLKAAPTIAAYLGMIYQEKEIWSLKSQVNDAKSKMVLTANALLNITEVEYETIEGKLNEVISKQQEILMQEQVTNYAENVVLLLTNIQLKHVTIIDITPHEELTTYIKPVLIKLPSMKLPDIGNDIFNVYPPVKSLQGDMVVVSFTIPLVTTQQYVTWVIIATPNLQVSSTILNNNARIQKVIVDKSNATYADITDLPLRPYMIIDNIKMIKMDDCINQIFENIDPTSCQTSETQGTPVIELYNELTIIFPSKNLKVTLQCNNEENPLTVAAIVNTTECTIYTDDHAFTGHKTITMTFNDDDKEIISPEESPGIKPLSHNLVALEQRSSLKAELERWTSPDTGRVIIEILGGVLLLTIFIIGFKCCTQRHPPPNTPSKWFPNYDSPMKMSSFNTLQSPPESVQNHT